MGELGIADEAELSTVPRRTNLHRIMALPGISHPDPTLLPGAGDPQRDPADDLPEILARIAVRDDPDRERRPVNSSSIGLRFRTDAIHS